MEIQERTQITLTGFGRNLQGKSKFLEEVCERRTEKDDRLNFYCYALVEIIDARLEAY